MKRALSFLPVTVFLFQYCFGQNPQFAVVRPNGTTYICPTIDSAYNKALNGDHIYLPGGSFSLSNPIDKQLYIIGAGSFLDSSLATGVTYLTDITILQGGANGSIEGINFFGQGGGCDRGNIQFGDGINNSPFSNYTVSTCYLSEGINFLMPSSNITLKNNILYLGSCNSHQNASVSGYLANSLLSNNVIMGHLRGSGLANLDVRNNLFFYVNQFTYLELAGNSNYSNNIFQSGGVTITTGNSFFQNNTNCSPQGTGNTVINNLYETFNSSFVSPGTPNPWGWYFYDIHNDYHVLPSSLNHLSGTDGTDRGIYGGTFPWKEGMVPSNPHIYFRQTAPQSNVNGQLPIQFKVRTGNQP